MFSKAFCILAPPASLLDLSDPLCWVFSPPLPRETGHIHLPFSVSVSLLGQKLVCRQVPLESGFSVFSDSEDQHLATRNRVPRTLTPSKQVSLEQLRA